MKIGWRPMVWTAVAALLLAPLLAMRFTDEVRWTGFDFAVATLLLVGAVAAYELAIRFVRTGRARGIIGGTITLLVLLIWAEGAVGIV